MKPPFSATSTASYALSEAQGTTSDSAAFAEHPFVLFSSALSIIPNCGQ
jgi:hypothetical protein